MVQYIGYHGSHLPRGSEMLDNQKMKKSMGDIKSFFDTKLKELEGHLENISMEKFEENLIKAGMGSIDSFMEEDILNKFADEVKMHDYSTSMSKPKINYDDFNQSYT